MKALRSPKSPVFLYLAALLVFLLGTVFFATTIVQGTLLLSSKAVAAGVLRVVFPWVDGSPLLDPFIRLSVPGKTGMDLTESGTYILFYEYREGSPVDRPRAEEILANLDISLLPHGIGTQHPVHLIRGNVTYALPGRVGKGILEFDIDTPGSYTLDVQFTTGRLPDSLSLTVGFDVMRQVVRKIALGIAVLLISMTAAVAVGLSTFIRERRFRKGIADQEDQKRY